MYMYTINDKLDNPVWYSLSESHRHLSLDFGKVKFYHPDFCTFGAIHEFADVLDGIKQCASLTESFYIVGQKPKLPDSLVIRKKVDCLQMTCHHLNQTNLENGHEIVELNSSHSDQLFELVHLVQPGYFRKKTPQMGRFFGVFSDEQLIAAAGRRIHLDEYIEISSIVTHPDHTRRGHAQMLTAHCVNTVLSEGKTPFLHVLNTNRPAILMYEKLGFTTRREMTFWNISA